MWSRSVFYSAGLTAALAISCWGASSPAIGPAIGIVTASGHFTVEKSQVWGNSTLFDGSTVETDAASSQLALRNGERVQLAAESRARVWNNRVVLEKGIGQIAGMQSYELTAGGLSIRPASADARVRVGLSSNGRVEVTALAGSARVMGAGLLLASIPGGRSMNFSMQAAATGAITRSGCLLFKDGHVFVQDDNTREIVELAGSNLNADVGNRVEVSGTASSAKPGLPIATSVLNVTSVKIQEQGGCLSVASALDARTDVPAGAAGKAAGAAATGAAAAAATATTATVAAAGGISTAATIGIVAAVGAGGAGAAIALTSGKKSTSP